MTHIIHFRQKRLDLSTPKVMGVLNVTPDSFSDGGRYNTMDNALNHARDMIKYGADIIDIGGESTRPNAPMIDTNTELDRVIPIVSAIAEKYGNKVWISVDTSNPIVMEQAINAGADMINDVRGLRRDGACEMAARLNCPVVIMHSRGEPDAMTQTMNDLALYDDVIKEVIQELQSSISNAIGAGVNKNNIIIDIGMGFAKNYDEHITLMKNLNQFMAYFNLPMLFGVSRKRFLGEVLNQLKHPQAHNPADRDVIGVVAHLLAIQQGASIVRVHDVAMMVQAIKMWQLVKS